MPRPAAPIGREVIAARMDGFPRRAVDRTDLKPAAVAVCLTRHDGDLSLIITRRASSMRAHAGQWALPGGRRDPGESAEHAALRELQEETGLELEPSDALGLLDDYVTRSGYVITPVVCWGGTVADLTGNQAEVVAVHHVRLTHLDVEPRYIRIPESTAPVIQLPLFGRFIHAPTAAILHQFCQLACRQLVTRVAHLEQPVFAWR